MGTACVTLAGSFVLAVSRLVSFWDSPMLAPFGEARPAGGFSRGSALATAGVGAVAASAFPEPWVASA